MTGPILIVEDDDVQLEMLAALLRRKLDYGCHKATNGHEALKILADDNGNSIRLVILDLYMPVMDGMETLEIIRQQYPRLPVVILTGSRDIEDATNAIKKGATDFLAKPYQAERLLTTVKNALKIGTLSHELSRLKSEQENRYGFQDLIGWDSGLASAVSIGKKAAAADIPVLITGETGTGKDVFARAIHGESSRAGHPFIAVNCGAIPTHLAESTLFGHEKGSFTGATGKTLGKFREAEGGTIFLDEIGELPPEVQVKLLRVLQQHEVEPVGGGKPVPVNVRVISATNRNLEADVHSGRFREDLFFRINVLNISLPSLKERRQDIPALTWHFIERLCARESRPLVDIAPEALKQLSTANWPGNIRQLENVIARAVVLGGGYIEEVDINSLISHIKTQDTLSSHSQHVTLSILNEMGSFKTLEQIEEEVIHSALKYFNGNATKTAEALGIAKSTFYRKIK